ncbi:TetR/AcrR family transcriptional regulator [Cryobacterium sp. PH29-G1]|uniref:TetR/AcrR family transcriptional regulator n=1 Tax=Cryobacterium sp. PH29-G1 TaxID=3046211 RepID=UPI0024BAC91B|nr:TetR/AcrR family transcriptional regulator [Cryobacterium sp. PH29-G1]MDJ0349898.1 TetR/AcrR family transcriptional regulator [Cryobacterium sp. PH29-G1]
MTPLTSSRPQAGEVKSAEQPEVSLEPKLTHDPRAERTRQLIFTAIRTLIAQPAASVSVADIVRLAGISRSSFYAHFASLDVLAAELLQAQFADIGSAGLDLPRPRTGENASRLGYARLVAHMVENFPLYASVLELPLTRSAHDQIIEAYATRMLRSVLVFDDAVNAELVTTYVAGGALTLIGAWMRGHLDVSDDELVDQLVALLPGWLLDTPASSATPARVASPTQN